MVHMSMKYLLARRVPSDQRRDAGFGDGSGQPGNNAHGVEHTQPRGWSMTPSPKKTAAARGAARYGSDDFRSAAAGKKICTEGFG
jgi:hypothetical protein